MTFARFAYGVMSTRDGVRPGVPEWLDFIHEVNAVDPGLFGAPEMRNDYPRDGYNTEVYGDDAGDDAWVVHAQNQSEGIRIVAKSDRALAAFREAARRQNIHLSDDAQAVPGTAPPAP